MSYKRNNKGLQTVLALDTLGNAYLYLREAYSTTTWKTAEGQALLDTADILHQAFKRVKHDFNLLDFTIAHKSI